MKICAGCKIKKSVKEFWKHGDGVCSRCIPCSKELNKTPEAKKRMARADKKRYKTKKRQICMKESYLRLKDGGYYKRRGKTLKGKFWAYKNGAKFKKREFTLTFEQFKQFWQNPCYYCRSDIITIGLDRINNKKGYTITNVVPCCEACNKMKLDMTIEKFVQHIEKIHTIMKGKDFKPIK